MDIVIKSFNRPYYLDRCLRSIYRYVTGDFTLRVLDDGTPPEYLDRIRAQYPAVQIFCSPRYPNKVAALRRHVDGGASFDQKVIPFDFWVEQIRACSDIFLLIEDDIWITGPLDLAAFAQQMQAQRLAMVKLSWLGNERLNGGRRVILPSAGAVELEEMVPSIPLSTQTVFLNRFRVRSVLYHARLLRFCKTDMEYQLPLYALYAVASAFFKKEYWLHLWPMGQVQVDEAEQLRRAHSWWRRTGGRFAKTRQELTRTSFITSATNVFAGVRLDPFVLNYLLNEAWLRGDLDAMHDFPQDFAPEYLRPLLEAAANERATYPEWLRWTEEFKGQYRRLGCVVE
ncbi:hypothetical protein JAO73_04660 [Hymenobacter sp. BT523]|uniref:glycosyltransferase family 2 protein n=1 Tax=Hymenobacter sp. BT523 TaxID=2795725 RepID=UPI0018ECC296|nr:hypothetical protein [Hymenobacter sp. BT523]MBJ6108290.1 hypothetical protein [Hymenobacter sp. BT523]